MHQYPRPHKKTCTQPKCLNAYGYNGPTLHNKLQRLQLYADPICKITKPPGQGSHLSLQSYPEKKTVPHGTHSACIKVT
jgi:hypothetical protein